MGNPIPGKGVLHNVIPYQQNSDLCHSADDRCLSRRFRRTKRYYQPRAGRHYDLRRVHRRTDHQPDAEGEHLRDHHHREKHDCKLGQAAAVPGADHADYGGGRRHILATPGVRGHQPEGGSDHRRHSPQYAVSGARLLLHSIGRAAERIEDVQGRRGQLVHGKKDHARL